MVNRLFLECNNTGLTKIALSWKKRQSIRVMYKTEYRPEKASAPFKNFAEITDLH